MKQQDLFGFGNIEIDESQKKYSHKIDTPIYTPRVNGGGVIYTHVMTHKSIKDFYIG